MNALRTWLRDLLALARRRRADAEIEEEMRLHIDLQTEQHVRSGASPEEARRRALVDFGGVDRYRERTADARHGGGLDELLRDVRQGVRALWRSPLYALTATVLLGLGTGAAAAMFAISSGVLHRDLPYAESDRLYNLFESNAVGGIRSPSYLSFEDWQRRLTTFESIAYIRGDEFRLRSEEGTQRLLAGYVSDHFFATVGTRPRLGRTLGAGDETSVVLSDHVWRRRFGADPGVLGRSLVTGDGSYTVVGVMPPGFRIPGYADVWLSVRAIPPAGRFALTERDLRVDTETWGRLRAGVTREQARQELEGVVGSLAAEYPEAGEWTQATLVDVRTQVIGDSAARLRILTGAVALVLLLACVNVAGLQLARGSARVRELAVRSALGAGRRRLIRQLLTESAVLSIAGAALGGVLAWTAVTVLVRALPDVLPRLADVSIGAATLGFVVALAILTTLLTGLVPAFTLLRPHLALALRSGTAGAGTSGSTARVRSTLVSVQVALALVLVTGSALLLRSIAALNAQQLGFEADNVMTLRIFPPSRYEDEAASRALYVQLREAVDAVPGVRATGLANHVPFAGGWMVTRFDTGDPAPEAGDNVIIRTVSPEYFEVMKTQLLRGRLLDARDGAVGTGIVVNRAAALRFFGDSNPVGRGVTIFHSAQGRADFGTPVAATIVGVVESERFFSLSETPLPAVFVPWSWMVWPSITLLARTEGTARIEDLRDAVHRVDADIPVAGPGRQAEWRALEDHIGFSLRQRRLTAGLFTAFGATSLVLAITGIFGTTAYLVTQRRREIAIRAAIGASRAQVMRLVLGHAARIALAGAAVGVPAALAAGTLLRAELFGVSAASPLVVGGVTMCFIVVAALAAAIPAARAAALPPALTLRSD